MKERLTEFLAHLGIGQDKFEKSVGLSRGFVNKLGDNTTLKTIDKISSVYPNLNINWLKNGVGTMLKTEGLITEARKIESSEYATTTAPLISQYAAAGYLAGFSDREYIEQQPVYVAKKRYSGGNYVAFEIRGDSMNDGLLRSIINADVVLGKELRRDYWKCKLHTPKVFIIVHKTSGVLCKEIIEHDVDSGVVTCHSFNPENRDFQLNLNDIAQLFYIKEISREP